VSDDIRICKGPTCGATIRFVTVDGRRVPVNVAPDADGSIVVVGKDSGVRMTADQRATLQNWNVYMEHSQTCSDIVWLRLRQRDAHPQQRYAGARR
jgi:glucose dehydrogenase